MGGIPIGIGNSVDGLDPASIGGTPTQGLPLEDGTRRLMVAIMTAAIEDAARREGSPYAHSDNRGARATAQWWWLDDARRGGEWGSAESLCDALGFEREVFAERLRRIWDANHMLVPDGARYPIYWTRRPAGELTLALPAPRVPTTNQVAVPKREPAPKIDRNAWDFVVRHDYLPNFAEFGGLHLVPPLAHDEPATAAETACLPNGEGGAYGSQEEKVEEPIRVQVARVAEDEAVQPGDGQPQQRSHAIDDAVAAPESPLIPPIARILRACANAHAIGASRVLSSESPTVPALVGRHARARRYVMAIALSVPVPPETIAAYLGASIDEVAAAPSWLFRHAKQLRICAQIAVSLTYRELLDTEAIARWTAADAWAEHWLSLSHADRARENYWRDEAPRRNPETRARKRAYHAAWRAKNRDHVAAYRRDYRKAHPEETREWQRRTREREGIDVRRARHRRWYDANRTVIQAKNTAAYRRKREREARAADEAQRRMLGVLSDGEQLLAKSRKLLRECEGHARRTRRTTCG